MANFYFPALFLKYPVFFWVYMSLPCHTGSFLNFSYPYTFFPHSSLFYLIPLFLYSCFYVFISFEKSVLSMHFRGQWLSQCQGIPRTTWGCGRGLKDSRDARKKLLVTTPVSGTCSWVEGYGKQLGGHCGLEPSEGWMAMLLSIV